MIPDSITLALAIGFFMLAMYWWGRTPDPITDEERQAAEDAADTDHADRADAWRKGEFLSLAPSYSK